MPDELRKVPGRPSRYRNKVRSPVSILLTPRAHEFLAQQLREQGCSRSDWVEHLIRLAAGDEKAA